MSTCVNGETRVQNALAASALSAYVEKATDEGEKKPLVIHSRTVLREDHTNFFFSGSSREKKNTYTFFWGPIFANTQKYGAA